MIEVRDGPDFIVAFQYEENGLWHLDFQWGAKIGDPKSDRSTWVTRITACSSRKDPLEAFADAEKWPYELTQGKKYIWGFSQRKPEMAK